MKNLKQTLDFISIEPNLSLDQELIITSSSDDEVDKDSDVIVKTRNEVKRPKKYKVMLHNDDYTTMDFVILVLKKFFGKTQEQAMGIMLKVHHEGKGLCGVYTFEVAETKSQKVVAYARQSGHPLKCTIEEE